MKRLNGKGEILVFTVLIIAGLYIIFRPTKVTRGNSIEMNTIVDRITEGSEKNVILKLDKGEGTFYINHGLKKGLNLESLKSQLINKEVTVLYLKPSFAGRFSPVASTKYITELRIGSKIIYSEL